MPRIFKFAGRVIAVAGLIAAAAPALAGDRAGAVQLAFHANAQTATLPVGTIRLRVIERVLTNDPASGVMRHADAGYESAIDCAREHGLNLPMIEG